MYLYANSLTFRLVSALVHCVTPFAAAAGIRAAERIGQASGVAVRGASILHSRRRM